MSRAHLFAVPDPGDEQSPGEWRAPVPQPVPIPAFQPEPDSGRREPEADQLDDAEKTDDVDEPDIDEEEFEDAGEEPRRRALTLPDLSPFYDVRPLKELGPLAMEAGRHAGPPLRHALARAGHAAWRALANVGRAAFVVVICLCGGLRLLLALLVAWLSGQIGGWGGIPARFAIAVGATYVLSSAPAHHPTVPYAMVALFLLLLVAAGTGRIPEPGSKKKGKKTGEKGKSDAARNKGPAVGSIEKEKPKDAPRAGFFGRLGRLANSSEKAPAAELSRSPDEAPDGSPAEAGEQSDEEVQEPPAEPPLTALLRREIGGENGVHLVDLRPAMRAAFPDLATATNKELRTVLEEAGWDPSKTFRARGRAGRAGVHRNQLPPLPSPGGPREGGTDHSPHPGDWPRPANSSEAESGGEQSGERPGKGFRIVQDPERGPDGWKVEHDER